MHFYDWLIVVIPIVCVIGVALHCRRYSRGVVDFLAAGRVARRFVLTTGSLAADLSLLGLVATVEAKYLVGYGMAFWEVLTMPIGIIAGLTGWCFYRFRETRALSGGQFLELRYSRSMRIIGSAVRITAEAMANSVGPTIAAKFFIYFLDLPMHVSIFGYNVPTFNLLVAGILILALCLILPGGRIALTVTDSIQACCAYPIFVIITIFILRKLSWSNEIVPVLTNHVTGESFINAFDTIKIKGFGWFMIIYTLIFSIYGRSSYAGNDSSAAAITPHEQKMAAVLNSWRFGFSSLMFMVIALCVITIMTHPNYTAFGHNVRTHVAERVMEQIDPNMANVPSAQPAETATVIQTAPAEGAAPAAADGQKIAEAQVSGVQKLRQKLDAMPRRQQTALDTKLSHDDNVDTPYLEAASEVFGDTPEGKKKSETFATVFRQMLMPVSMRELMPGGIIGLFALLCTMLMVTTDDSRIFNAAAAAVQDLVVPFCKTPMSPKTHLLVLRLSSIGVAIFFYFCAMIFSQLEYIQMFITILSGIWTAAACPIMVFGLYSRFGNTVGAYCAIIFGGGCNVLGVLIRTNWADIVYPLLQAYGWAEPFRQFLEKVMHLLSPVINWNLDPEKFSKDLPVDTYQIMLIALVLGTIGYIVGSLLTYRGPFNLERMLHRGAYAIKDQHLEVDQEQPSFINRLVGITKEYNFKDKALAWASFCYCVIWQFGLCCIAVIIWNLFSPWSDQAWCRYFLWVNIIITIIIGIITTVWFLCGGTHDIVALFRDLAKRVDNPLDNGQVFGNVSLADLEATKAVEAQTAAQAPAAPTSDK